MTLDWNNQRRIRSRGCALVFSSTLNMVALSAVATLASCSLDEQSASSQDEESTFAGKKRRSTSHRRGAVGSRPVDGCDLAPVEVAS